MNERPPDSGFAQRDDAKDRVREATDIVDLVGTYLSLRRQGKSMVGLCPWHDDSRPSLAVNPDRQTFRCWVCNVGGDVFSFMMKMERVEFPEALELLASRAGIELPRGRRQSGGSAGEKQELLRVLEWAAGRYRQALEALPVAAKAREYVDSRGLSADIARAFGLGFAPDEWDWLTRQAADAGIPARHLVATGLAVERQERSGHYDRFRNRLMFPIRDPSGHCIAFGGRVLPGAQPDTAKYINSPETALFSKSSTLYGLDTARESIIASHRAIVVEGYTDCLAARQAGVKEVVAVLGTALGERHAKLLRRYADRVVLVLDGDEAGRRRADEILDLLLSEPIDLRIARLPAGVDPCDLLTAEGSDAFEAVVASACDPLDYRMDEALARLPKDAGDEATLAAIESVLVAVARAGLRTAGGGPAAAHAASQVRIREEQILGRLSRRFGLPVDVLRGRLTDVRRQLASKADRSKPSRGGEPSHAASGPILEAPVAPAKLPPWDREVLEVLVGVPGSAGVLVREISREELESTEGRAVFEAACRLHEAGRPVELTDLLDALPDPRLQSLLVEVDESGSGRGLPDPAERLGHLREAIRRRVALRTARTNARHLRTGRLDPEAEADLLEQLVAQRRVAQGMTDPKDG